MRQASSRKPISSVAATRSCPTCATIASRAFHTNVPRAFAFKWFKQSNVQQKQRERWLQVLDRRRHGGLSLQEVAFMLECVEQVRLDEQELVDTIQATLQTESETHDALAAKAFAVLKAQRAAQVTPKDPVAGIEACLPQLIQALASSGPIDEALSICRHASRHHAHSQSLWHTLLQSLAYQSRLQDFLTVRKCMTEDGVPVDVAIVNLHLAQLNAGGLAKDALNVYESLSTIYVEPDLETRLLALDACMQTEDLSTGDRIALELKSDDTLEAMAKLLSWDVYTGQAMDEVLSRAMKSGLTLSTLNSMLFAATLSRRWQSVEQIWTALADAPDILPNETTFSLRMEAAIGMGDVPHAKTVFEQSQQSGFAELLDPRAILSLLKAEMTSGRSDPAFSQMLLDILLKQEPFPIKQESLLFLIPTLIQRKQYAQLENIIEQCRLASDWSTIETVQRIAEQASTATDGKQVWNISILLRNLFWDDPAYTLQHRNLLLKRLIELKDVDKLIRMFHQFFQSQIKPDVGMYTLMLHGGQDLREVDVIRSVHASIKMDVNLSEHTRILTTLMRAYAHVGAAETYEVWNQIFHGGHGPTQASVSVVMDACAHMRMPTRGLFIWQSLQRRNFAFNDNNFASLVEVFTRNGDPEGVLPLLADAVANKQDVGPRTLSTLWNTARGMRPQTREWALEHCSDVWQQLEQSPIG
jgi:hypothetical protein